jgi:predicted kinase
MKKLILIGGVLASGKSTYSMILKEKFKINVINKDILKEILGDNIYVKTREENKKLSVICFDLMKYLLFANESVLVLECNFKDYELIELKKIVDKLNYQVLSIVFDARNEILHERFLKRLNENRHYVHKSQDFTNIEDFIKTQDELRNAPYFGKIINVNCDDFSYQEDTTILDQINEFLNK